MNYDEALNIWNNSVNAKFNKDSVIKKKKGETLWFCVLFGSDRSLTESAHIVLDLMKGKLILDYDGKPLTFVFGHGKYLTSMDSTYRNKPFNQHVIYDIKVINDTSLCRNYVVEVVHDNWFKLGELIRKRYVEEKIIFT